MLGVHWIADALGCAPDRFEPASLRRALVELPDRLGLSRVGDPQLSEHVDGERRSIAGIVLLAESHVSIHAFVTEGAVHVDVFSCRAVNLDEARSFVAEHFGARELIERVIERGVTESEAP
jgi:S-adenosylmethionine decarboxylase